MTICSFNFLCNKSCCVGRTVTESPASQPQLAAVRPKVAAPDEVPKKKDGRGRPRKDRTLELAKSAGTPVTTTTMAVGSLSDVLLFPLLLSTSRVKKSTSELHDYGEITLTTDIDNAVLNYCPRPRCYG